VPGLLGIPRERLPLLALMVAALVVTLSWLQGRFDGSDVRKGIALALGHRPRPGGPTIFELLLARGEGDPGCDGQVVSMVLGDVRVSCATPARPAVHYEFRVLLGKERAPRPDGDAARALLDEGSGAVLSPDAGAR
jgi:hypothetical protein